MILNEIEVTERMNSPLNLLNRLRTTTKSHKSNSIISLPPTSTDIIDDLEEKLQYGSIKSKAAGIMIAAMDELNKRLPEVNKPEQLAKIAESMGKVVSAENANKSDKIIAPQIHYYAPTFHNEEHYETIYARE